jgi:hypothetical protein
MKSDVSIAVDVSVVFVDVAEKLARALRLYAGCSCEYARTKGGVPLWFAVEGGGIARRLIRQCGKCAALEQYDRLFPGVVSSESRQSLESLIAEAERAANVTPGVVAEECTGMGS